MHKLATTNTTTVIGTQHDAVQYGDWISSTPKTGPEPRHILRSTRHSLWQSPMGHCRSYAFLHEGKYYCFLDEDDDYGEDRRGGADIVQILQEGGEDLLETLRTVFDFVETGVSSDRNRESGGGDNDSHAMVRDNPNPEWERAFAQACRYFTNQDFPAFGNLELVDLGRYEGRLISSTNMEDTEDLCAIDLDRNLFHQRHNNSTREYLVLSHPIPGLTKQVLQDLGNQEPTEEGFCSQSFPLPHEYQKALVDDLARQGYRFRGAVTQSYAPLLWRVTEDATGEDRCVHIFLPLPSELSLVQYPPLYKRHMAVAELLVQEPHPHLAPVRATLTLHGNPAVILDYFESDLQGLRDTLTREQINRVIAQTVQGIIYLHQHGMVHHNLHPSTILVNRRESGDDGRVEAAIYDFRSVSIPSTHYQNPHGLATLNRAGFLGRETNRLDDRWRPGWAPLKKSHRFLRQDFGTANPWTIDCSSVAMIFLLHNLELYQAYRDSSVSDYRDHAEFSVFFNVVNLFQSHAKTSQDAVQELEATVRTLSSLDTTHTESREEGADADPPPFLRAYE